MSPASRGLAPREGLECLLVKMGRTRSLVEPRRGPQAGMSGDPRSQDTDKDEEEEEESNPKDTKYAYHEHMALASRQFWSNKNSRHSFNKNNSCGAKGKQHVRTCYNCGKPLCCGVSI